MFAPGELRYTSRRMFGTARRSREINVSEGKDLLLFTEGKQFEPFYPDVHTQAHRGTGIGMSSVAVDPPTNLNVTSSRRKYFIFAFPRRTSLRESES